MLKSLRLPAALAAMIALIAPDTASAQNTAINQVGTALNTGALLDLDDAGMATRRGLLIPRMTGTERAAIAAPANGLWVYQTDDIGGEHGLWYYDISCACPGAAWVRMPNGTGWKLLGTSGTTGGTNYLGTFDAQPLVLRTNNVERMRFLTTGQLGINTTTPAEMVEVNGAMRQFTAAGAGSATNLAGGMRFGNGIGAHEGNTDGTATGWERMENVEKRFYNQGYAGSVLQCAPGSAVQTSTGISAGVTGADTPFPTAPGANARGSNVQYLFRGTELTAMGLCNGNISMIEFKVIGDDPLGPPACALNLHVSITNTASTALAAYDATALNACNVSPQFTATNITVGAGWYQIPLTPAFNWAGGNIIIDVAYARSTTAGISPGVELTTAAFNSTRWGSDASALSGWFFTDTPLNPGTIVLGVTTKRPIVRFTGQAQVSVPTPATADYYEYPNGLMIEKTAGWASTPGNFQGPGVIRAEVAVYDGNVALSDHVFDKYFDGAVRPEDERSAARYNYVELNDLKDYLATNRHLPTMPSRQEWETGGKLSLGDMGTRLWQTVETQALYITELEKQLTVLEDMAFDKDLTAAELDRLVAEVNGNPHLTAEQKAQLIAGLQARANNSQK